MRGNHLALFCAAVLFLTACEGNYSLKLSGPQDPVVTHDSQTDAPPPTCSTTVLQTLKEPLRVLFMLDNSGSVDMGEYPTDPDKSFRLNPIRNFLSQYRDVQKLSYSFGYFAGLAYIYDPSASQADKYGFMMDLSITPYDDPMADMPELSDDQSTSLNGLLASNGPSVYSQPFGGPDFLQKAVDEFQDNHPGLAYTHYPMAFSALQTLISDDEKANPSANYSVVFLSDGMPTEMRYFKPKTTDQELSDMMGRFQSALQVNGHQVSVSTVYFGPVDPYSSGLLKNMVTGGGQFVDSNDLNGTPLKIDHLIPVIHQTCDNGS